MSQQAFTHAYEALRDHVKDNLSGKGGMYTGWIRIDGSLICSECPRHKRSALYIYLKKGKVPFLKCFRINCDIRRYITLQDLQKLGFTDKEAIKTIFDKCTKSSTNEIVLSDQTPVIIEDIMPDIKQSIYFNKRTGLDLLSVMSKYRIIPNLYEVITDTFKDKPDILEKFNQLKLRDNKQAISFMTHDSNMFIYRHIQLNIKTKFSVGESHGYVLRRGRTIENIVITEGVFDIINIYNYFGVMDNTLYCATLGSSAMLSCIKYWYSQYPVNIKQLIIFADSDVELKFGRRTYNKKFIDSLLYKLDKAIGPDAFKEVWVAYNKIGKDFGDLSEPHLGDKIRIR